MNEARSNPIVLIVGTRPEGIKMAPVYYALKQKNIPLFLCSTLQHDHLLTEVLDVFNIVPDINLHIMRQGQDLFYLTQAILQKTKELFIKLSPRLVIVQGDTTSSMAAALAAFYLKIPVAHVEAGLRTYDPQLPFPEEVNRKIIASLATHHFAPTSIAQEYLLKEGVASDRIVCTGNTVIDALQMIKKKIDAQEITVRADLAFVVKQARAAGKKICLFTIHRRESFGNGIASFIASLKTLLVKHPDLYCIYPYHPNPHVIEAIRSLQLNQINNLFLCEPLLYSDMIYLLHEVDFVATDSGGLQEEAVSLGKKVLVLRDKTERLEGVLAGYAELIGSDNDLFIKRCEHILHSNITGESSVSLYGLGNAGEKIASVVEQYYKNTQTVFEQQQVGGALRIRRNAMKKVCVVGLGYIGLPTAIVAADSGFDVIGFDIDERRVSSINAGDPVIYEPEVYERLLCALGAQHFRAAISIEAADYFIIAVPTPLTADKKAQLSYVYAAIDSLISVIQKGNTIIIESTISVGTTDAVALYVQEKTNMKVGIDVFIAHCPERVLPGKIFYELVHNDRIIGGITQACVQKAKEFYKAFVQGALYLTQARVAELVKLVENSSRDVELAFAHQVASIAHELRVNPYEVIELANKHPRVSLLRPSVGVGGHCIAIDPWFLTETFPAQTQLIKAAREVNDAKPYEVISRIIQEVDNCKTLRADTTCTVLLLGVTYKPNVDDLRESPALHIVQELQKKTVADIIVYDPYVPSKQMKDLFAGAAVSLAEGLKRADIVAFLVAHDRFATIDIRGLDQKRIIDFCGILYQPKTQLDTKEVDFWATSSDTCSMIDYTKATKGTYETSIS